MASVAFAATAAEFAVSLERSKEIVVVAPSQNFIDGSALQLLRAGGGAVAEALGRAVAAAMAADCASAEVSGSCVSSLVATAPGGEVLTLTFVPLPDSASRHYSPTQSMAISGGLASAGVGGADTTVLIVLRSERDDFGDHIAVRGPAYAVGPAASAIGRACPVYSRKTSGSGTPSTVTFGFISTDMPGELLLGPLATVVAHQIVNAVRLTARLGSDLYLNG